MKKVFPHILTSLITIVVVFSGIFLYDIFNKKSTIVCDYIAGMTDDYFINRYNEIANIKVKR